jgi:hypothetical protein
VTANGHDIVIATNGAIVSVGDNTMVHGNTGNAATSGSIAVDVSDSSVTSGNSTSNSVSDPRPASAPPPAPPSAPPRTAQPSAASGSPPTGSAPPGTGSTAGNSPQPVPTAAPPGGAAGATTSRSTALAGYEIRSIGVDGNENLVTYDDSALFFHRTGTLNGNTGDTATSGVNVVDSVGSRIRSGNSVSSGDSPETSDPPWSWPSGLPGPGTGGRTGASVADAHGISTAVAQDTLVIGGDGVVDDGVSVQGDRNVVTYDDGNATVGGTGNVNAQIGDSDTGGTVVMAVRDSDIAAGDSFQSTGGT